jgi:hypothetical protein
VDPSASELLEGITGTQAARAWPAQGNQVRLHETACSWRRAQQEGTAGEWYWHAGERRE